MWQTFSLTATPHMLVMRCERCDEEKLGLQILSRVNRERVCIDCFCSETKHKTPRKSKEQVQKDLKQAMQDLDEAMREVEEIYPDLKNIKVRRAAVPPWS